MGSSCPWQNSQPAGAKEPAKMAISPMKVWLPLGLRKASGPAAAGAATGAAWGRTQLVKRRSQERRVLPGAEEEKSAMKKRSSERKKLVTAAYDSRRQAPLV